MITLIIDGNILDVTYFIDSHPGGIYYLKSNNGKDVTDIFYSIHPNISYSKYITKNIISKPQNKYINEFRNLDKWMKKMGWYKPSVFYFILHCLPSIFLFLLSLYNTLNNNIKIGAILLGMCWQTTAGLGHDLGHSSVFKSRFLNHIIGSTFTSITGLSTLWWRYSHFQHHINTNILTEDPDIIHLPLFAITEKLLKIRFHRFLNKFLVVDYISKKLIHYQYITLYPLLLFARINLYVQSILYLVKTFNTKVVFYWIETFGLIIFYVWYIYLLILMGMEESIKFLLLSHIISGILHIQIVISHWSSETYEKEIYVDHYIHTLNTTIDIECHKYIDWLHIGLQFQIVHHMFPRLPRQYLRQATEIVKDICKRHNLPYKSTSFINANKLLLENMYNVSKKIN